MNAVWDRFDNKQRQDEASKVMTIGLMKYGVDILGVCMTKAKYILLNPYHLPTSETPVCEQTGEWVQSKGGFDSSVNGDLVRKDGERKPASINQVASDLVRRW